VYFLLAKLYTNNYAVLLFAICAMCKTNYPLILFARDQTITVLYLFLSSYSDDFEAITCVK
jgi:hypothetical protein